MPYRIEITPAAFRDLKRLPPDVRPDIVSVVQSLADDPRPQGSEKLEGADDLYRVRCGSYRVIYEVVNDVLTVTIVRTRHRREVYKNMSDLLKKRRWS